MSQDETLRLAAEVVDKMSPTLKQMQRNLASLSTQFKNFHTVGIEQNKEHVKRFDQLHDSVRNVSERIRGALAPAMTALGVGSVSAAAGISAVVAAVKGFAGSAQHLSDISKETGLSIQQLRIFESLAARVGSSGAAMEGGLENLAQKLEQMRRNRGDLNKFFLEQPNLGVKRIGDELRKGTDNAKAFKLLLDAIGRIDTDYGPSSEQQKKYLLGAAGLPAELSRKTGKELQDELARISKIIRPLSPQQIEDGKRAKQAFDDLADSIGSLKEQVGGSLAADFTKMTDAIRHFVEENEDGLIKALKEVAADIESANWKGFAETIKNAATQVNGVAQAVGGWKNVMEGLVAIKVMAWLAPIVTAVGALAGGLTTIARLGPAAVVGGLAGMKRDSETGNHARTWLRNKLGIEDPGEPAPWMPGGQFDTGGPSLGQLLNPHRHTGNAAKWHSRMHGFIPFHATDGGGEKPEETIRKGVKEGFIDGLREGFHLNSFSGDGFGGGAGVIRASYGAFGGGSGAMPGAGGGGVGAVRRALGAGGAGSSSDAGGGASGSVRTGKNQVAAGVADAWRKQGMSEAGIAGILGNIQQESAFNPGLRHPDQPRFGGEAHYAHGLYQEGGDEWNHYAAWLSQAHPGGDWRNPDFQNEFAAANLKKNYPKVWAEMSHARSPEEAAIAYRRGYLKPAPWAANDANRTSSARRFFQSMPAAHRNAFIEAARRAHSLTPRARASDGVWTQNNLLDNARSAGMIGPASQKVTGSASLDINLRGFPRGTETKTGMSGLFKEVKLNRGRVPYADQDA